MNIFEMRQAVLSMYNEEDAVRRQDGGSQPAS